jgi:hypothetical protein
LIGILFINGSIDRPTVIRVLDANGPILEKSYIGKSFLASLLQQVGLRVVDANGLWTRNSWKMTQKYTARCEQRSFGGV